MGFGSSTATAETFWSGRIKITPRGMRLARSSWELPPGKPRLNTADWITEPICDACRGEDKVRISTVEEADPVSDTTVIDRCAFSSPLPKDQFP
jgi:hypothetical protein